MAFLVGNSDMQEMAPHWCTRCNNACALGSGNPGAGAHLCLSAWRGSAAGEL